MLMPVRCFSCGKVIGHLWEEFKRRSQNEPPEKILDDLGVSRYCCRRMFISQGDFMEDLLKYER